MTCISYRSGGYRPRDAVVHKRGELTGGWLAQTVDSLYSKRLHQAAIANVLGQVALTPTRAIAQAHQQVRWYPHVEAHGRALLALDCLTRTGWRQIPQLRVRLAVPVEG